MPVYVTTRDKDRSVNFWVCGCVELGISAKTLELGKLAVERGNLNIVSSGSGGPRSSFRSLFVGSLRL